MHICLFDIDGTLIRSGGAGQGTFEVILEQHFGIVEGCEGVSFSGRTDRAILRDLFARHAIEDSEDNWNTFREAYLELLPQKMSERPGWVLPGVVELLAELTARDDVLLGLLTGNLAEGARLKLSHYGLFDHFRFGGFGDVHVDRNDVARDALANARAYQEETNGSSNGDAEVWVIGDTPLDVAAARAIDARAIAVLTGWHSRERLGVTEPDLLLDDLTDTETLLALWDQPV
ncbi:MAG: HAD family hydrolase [Planctomycetota bacterium]|nr:MAG: HAD family hydrolase [Planctomycetota bacterium]REJ96719.1 MAG: HAD family hydrolase [Planctomycetota bacterium]REK22320.1 MAG: HAD family hydrolase [Planctomycetota bacterium]REK41053.1 MAG: HAD family hydrolase [Planctomycetota bacterium]